MAYPTWNTLPFFADVNADTVTVPLPVHELNDFVLMVVTQDNGSTLITTSSTGWTEYGTQITKGGSRSALFWKVMTWSAEPDMVLLWHLETWTVLPIVLKDVDTTTPVEVITQTDWTWRAPTCPAITTLTDNALLIYAIGSDNARAFVPTNPNETTNIDKLRVAGWGWNANAVSLIQAWTAWLYPAVPFIHENSEGWSAYTLAIKSTWSRARMTVPWWINLIHKYWQALVANTFTDASLDYASINWIATVASTPTLSNTLYLSWEAWGTTTQFWFNDVALDLWVWLTHILATPYNATGENIAITFELSTTNKVRFSPEWLLIVLQDTLWNWGAFQMSSREEITPVKSSTFTFTPTIAQQYDWSAVALDITDISKISYMHHRWNSTSLMQQKIVNLIWKTATALTGGSEKNPVSPAFMKQALTGWAFYDQWLLQGSGQWLATTGIQIWDWVIETYADFTATSYETTPRNALNKIDDYTTPFTVKTSASDTMLFKSAVIKTNTANVLKYDATSSIASTDDWAGCQLIWWDVEWLVWKTFNDATFTDWKVLQNWWTFNWSSFNDAIMTAEDLWQIIDCKFYSSWTGHWIEITTVWTYTFTWNKFNGFAVADWVTWNEAIYNNSWWLITINIAGGWDTPTIHNGVGATTTVNNSVTLTLTGLINWSDVVILEWWTSNVLADVDQWWTSFAYSYSISWVEIDIGIIKPWYIVKYIYWFLLASTDSSIPVKQSTDRDYML